MTRSNRSKKKLSFFVMALLVISLLFASTGNIEMPVVADDGDVTTAETEKPENNETETATDSGNENSSINTANVEETPTNTAETVRESTETVAFSSELPELSGDWNKDLVTVAKSQLTFKADDDFINKCLKYAKIDETEFPSYKVSVNS